MIGKLRMHSGDIGFRHVATCAVGSRHRTNSGSRVVAGRFSSSRVVAPQAAVIIKARAANQRLMRIMTCGAGQAGIALGSPAAAFLRALWLKAHVDRPVGLGGLNHVRRGPVARAAKVHRLHGAQIRGIEYGLYGFATLIGVNRFDVL